MCGIAGVVAASDPVLAVTAVQRMVDALARRGPDGYGIERWEGAVLGHRRLAIFDLSPAGRQPMVSADRSAGLVFNGAIYNFAELRVQLASSGYAFRSNTDTEVLLHGYRHWGIDGLVLRLRGMFAFALWDDAARTLYLVRDRLGVKPLVYAAHGQAIAFASTVRALRVGGFVGELDDATLANYLELGFVPEEDTIYRGAVKVPPASILEWTSGGCRIQTYWTPPTANDSHVCSLEDAVTEAERLLLQAVERRLHADVPVGALLSGGIDSGLVCWAVARLGGDVTAYTVGTSGDPSDETADASATAAELGIDHRVVAVTATEGPAAEDIASAYAEPFACASALGMLLVSGAVATSAKVLLTGDGGDDVFLGYPRHRHLWAAQKLAARLPVASARAWLGLRRAIPPIGPLRRGVHFVDYAVGGLSAFLDAHDGLPTYRRMGLLGDRLLSAVSDQRGLPWGKGAGRRVLSDYLQFDRGRQFVAEYLTKVDGATMHFGLEARSPFLDQDLWEFAGALPYGVRMHRGRLKAVLRELARRRISERVARGRKRGFGVPVQRWLVDRWYHAVEATMRDSVLVGDGWIRGEAFFNALRVASRRGWAPLQLWYVFVLETWLRSERASPGPAHDLPSQFAVANPLLGP
jgi:asparagine synthase (glutamine-hydrolysing)